MSMYLWLYLFTKLDEIKSFLAIDAVWVLWFMASILILFAYTFYNNEPFGIFDEESYTSKDEQEKYLRRFKKVVRGVVLTSIVLFCCQTVSLLIPSTKQAAFIIVAGKGLNSETVESITGLDHDIAEFIKRKAQEYLGEQKGRLINEQNLTETDSSTNSR